jgi:hypothetical protein
MAEIFGIIASLFTAGQVLEGFAHQIHNWKLLSERLLDLRAGLDDTEIALVQWKHRYQIEERHRRIYMEVLFGKDGCERITSTLESIRIITRAIQGKINKLIDCALQVRPIDESIDGHESEIDETTIKNSLHRIRQNISWSQKFALSGFGKADEVEKLLDRLDKMVGKLERLSDHFLANEHPGIYAEMKRLPGRKVISTAGDGRTDEAVKHLRNANAAREDAQLLHKASGKGSRAHIGLSVPQLSERDFALLLNLERRTDEILLRPVKIKTVHNSPRVKSDFSTAIPALRNNPQADHYVLPIAASSNGFHIKLASTSHLVDLEHKDSLATIIRNRDAQLESQILCLQDQSAIASGIAQSALRLIGSRWMDFFDCTNIRWRRTADGQWTSMLTAAPGNASTTRSLEQCYAANRAGSGSPDLTKHIHIFRIGLVLTELALKAPISYVDFDPSSNTVKLFINDGEEVDVFDLAAAVERESNVFLGNIVFYCLNVLQDKNKMRDTAIEVDYYMEVVKDAKELEGLMQADRRRGDKRPVEVGVGAGT